MPLPLPLPSPVPPSWSAMLVSFLLGCRNTAWKLNDRDEGARHEEGGGEGVRGGDGGEMVSKQNPCQTHPQHFFPLEPVLLSLWSMQACWKSSTLMMPSFSGSLGNTAILATHTQVGTPSMSTILMSLIKVYWGLVVKWLRFRLCEWRWLVCMCACVYVCMCVHVLISVWHWPGAVHSPVQPFCLFMPYGVEVWWRWANCQGSSITGSYPLGKHNPHPTHTLFLLKAPTLPPPPSNPSEAHYCAISLSPWLQWQSWGNRPEYCNTTMSPPPLTPATPPLNLPHPL